MGKTYVRTRTFNTWDCMIQRCTNPNNTNFFRYGGRGIKVCDRWKVYKNFLEDMGERPLKTSLDRIEGDSGYSKKNCRWATQSTQNSNRKGYGNTGEKYISLEGHIMPSGNYTEFFRVRVPNTKRKAFPDLLKAIKYRDELLKLKILEGELK